MTFRTTFVIFGVLVVLFLGLTLVYLHLNRTSPTWDDAGYLTNSLILYDSLVDGGILRYGAKFLTVMDIKPPLIAALPTPIYLLAGRNFRAAYLVNIGALFLLLLAVFRIARKFGGARSGLLAMYVAGTMPMIYGLSHWYLQECSLIAIAAIAICLVWESGWGNTRKLFAAGLWCGLGLLLKFSFPLYILLPLLYSIWRNPPPRWRLRNVAAFVLPPAVLALPWYALHFQSALATALDTGSVETAARDVGSSVYSLPVLGEYLGALVRGCLPLYFAAIPALWLAVRRKLPPGARQGLKLSVVWLGPLLFLLAWRSREVRYAAPLYPAVAIALALLIDAALSRWSGWRRALFAGLLAPPLFSMLQVSFGVIKMGNIDWGGLHFIPSDLIYARIYDPRPWLHPEILKSLQKVADSSYDPDGVVLLGSDSGQFNADTFRLAAIGAKLPFEVMTLAYEPDWTRARALLYQAVFFVYEEGGGPRSAYYNRYTAPALKEIQENGEFRKLPIRSALPDGGCLRVFENLSRDGLLQTGSFIPAGMQTIPDGSVTFGGVLQLSGLAVQPIGGGEEVRYRWRCLRPIDREYWCFTHVLDAQGKAIAYLDHQISSGRPPMTTWKPGDLAIETVTLHCHKLAKGERYSLKLGLYDRTSGKRLLISESTLPVSDDRTAVLAGEEQRDKAPTRCPNPPVRPEGAQ